MAVNDRIMSSLVSHGGGTINERVYNYLGSLGFTGTISDRLAKYTHNNKRGWQALIEGFGLSGSAGVLRQELFGEGQEGVMYVPQPTYLGQQVLYQDAAGTTPVEADGDPVGLMLDLSRGLALGPELSSDYDSGDWSASGSSVNQWTFTATVASVDNTGGTASCYLGNNSMTEQGKTYLVEFEVLSSNGVGGVAINNGVGDITFSTVGEKRCIFRPSETFPSVFRFKASQDWVGSVSTASVREIPGNHATAPSDAARPLYRTDGTLHWLQFDGVDDVMANGSYFLDQPSVMSIAFSLDTAVASADILDSTSDGLETRNALLVRSSQYQIFSGTLLSTGIGVDTEPHVFLGEFKGSDSVAHLDGTSVVGNAETRRANGYSIFSGITNTQAGRFLGGVQTAGQLSEQEIGQLKDYLASLAGITL